MKEDDSYEFKSKEVCERCLSREFLHVVCKLIRLSLSIVANWHMI